LPSLPNFLPIIQELFGIIQEFGLLAQGVEMIPVEFELLKTCRIKNGFADFKPFQRKLFLLQLFRRPRVIHGLR